MAINKSVSAGVRGSPNEQTPLILTHDTDVSEELLGVAVEGGPVYVDGTTEEEEDSDGPNQVIGRLRVGLIIFSLWILIFFQAANMSGLTTTQSQIAKDLDAFSEASWFTSSYLIAMSSFAPLAGRLSQLFSPRNCILASALLFAIGGIVTSQAASLGVFLAGRGISGVGGAGILTISFILVLELADKKRRGIFIGLVNAGYTSGVALGAVIAGALFPITGWRALFWVQAPFALVAGAGLFFAIPKNFVSGPDGVDERELREKLKKVDYLGALTLTSSIILFLYGLSSAKIQWIPIIISFFVMIAFILTELYLSSTPVIPITVLGSRSVLMCCFAQLLFMAARWTVLFYSPVYAIAIKGWSPIEAGSILIPTNLGFATGGLLAGALHIKRGGSFYLSCIVMFVLFDLMIFAISQISTFSSPAILFIGAVFTQGLCTGAALNYTLAHALHLSLPNTHFIVISLLATFRGFSGSFGSAIGGGIFARLLRSALETGFAAEGIVGANEKEELIRKLLGSPALVWSGELTDSERMIAIGGYESAVRGLFLSATLCSLLAVLVQAGTGWRGPKEVKIVSETSSDED